MLARRLSPSQSLLSEVGTFARYVTTSGNLSLDPTSSSSLTHPRRHLWSFPATYAPKPENTRRPTSDLGQDIARNGIVLSGCLGWRQITTTGWNRSDQDENQSRKQAAVLQPLREETRRPEPRTPLALDDEMKQWLDTPPEAPKDPANAGSYINKPAVLVVKGASKSLLETDFYRLAPQGHHLDGWAGGIQKGLLPPPLPMAPDLLSSLGSPQLVIRSRTTASSRHPGTFGPILSLLQHLHRSPRLRTKLPTSARDLASWSTGHLPG